MDLHTSVHDAAQEYVVTSTNQAFISNKNENEAVDFLQKMKTDINKAIEGMDKPLRVIVATHNIRLRIQNAVPATKKPKKG